MKKRFVGRTVEPGSVAQINLKISETVTHKPATIPVTIANGINDGPTLFLTSALHGDEINGVAIVRRTLDAIDAATLSGTLIGVPVVNRFGFSSGSRYLPDRRDLNRFFPGDPEGSVASRIADRLFQMIVKDSDYGIDLHTAAAGNSNLCHIRGDAEDAAVKDLMKAFGAPIMVDGRGPKGSLRRAATEAGIPSILFEAGEPNRFQHHVVELGSEGVLRVMKHLGMIERRLPKRAINILVRRSEWIRADHGGILDMQVEPGDLVRKNQRLAVVHDPFGRHVDEILAPRAGVVLGTTTDPLSLPGAAVAHIGHLHKTLQTARAFVKEGGDLGHVNWPDSVRRKPKRTRKSG